MTTTSTTTTTCIFSGDGAGAQARLDHFHQKPQAVSVVYGVASKGLPACLLCARAWAKDGYMVRPIEEVSE